MLNKLKQNKQKTKQETQSLALGQIKNLNTVKEIAPNFLFQTVLVIIIRSTHKAFLNEKLVLFYIFPRQVPGTAKNERLPRHCGVQAWR